MNPPPFEFINRLIIAIGGVADAQENSIQDPDGELVRGAGNAVGRQGNTCELRKECALINELLAGARIYTQPQEGHGARDQGILRIDTTSSHDDPGEPPDCYQNVFEMVWQQGNFQYAIEDKSPENKGELADRKRTFNGGDGCSEPDRESDSYHCSIHRQETFGNRKPSDQGRARTRDPIQGEGETGNNGPNRSGVLAGNGLIPILPDGLGSGVRGAGSISDIRIREEIALCDPRLCVLVMPEMRGESGGAFDPSHDQKIGANPYVRAWLRSQAIAAVCRTLNDGNDDEVHRNRGIRHSGSGARIQAEVRNHVPFGNVQCPELKYIAIAPADLWQTEKRYKKHLDQLIDGLNKETIIISDSSEITMGGGP